MCRREDAALLIAKLDRLARNVHFLSGLMEEGVEFRACDMLSSDPSYYCVISAGCGSRSRWGSGAGLS